MKTKFHSGLPLAAMLLSLLAGAVNLTAQGEPWNSWMSGPKAKQEFESQMSMARLSERHDQPDKAKKIYTAILEKNPQHQLAHHRLAIVFAKEGNFAKADEYFNSAMNAGTPSAELMGDLGYCLFLQERFDEAEKTLRQTIHQFPSHKAAHNSLGMVLGHMGRYDEALDEFRQVVGDAEAHANLAFIMSQSGQLELASKHYHQALELDENLRPAAEALIQLNKHLPAQSAVFTRNPADSSKRTATANSSALKSTQSGALAKSGGYDQMAAVDATQMKSDDPNNPIPPVAKPSVPQTPQIPSQVQTPFKFGASAFQAPEATEPQSQQTASTSKASLAQQMIASVEEVQPSPSASVSPAQLTEIKPTLPTGAEQELPLAPVQPRIIDIPFPQVVASDEPDLAQELADAQADQIAAAKAQAELLMQASPLDQPQGYSTHTSAERIGTSISQTGSEYLPTAFITGPKESSASQPVQPETHEPKVLSPSATATSSAPATWKIVLLTVGAMFGLVSVGGAFWFLGKRRIASSSAYGRMSEVEERAFNMEETYTNLENQIRDVWAGRSQQNGTHSDGGSAAGYYR